jgi:WD repeat-containing protein 35
MQMEKKQGQWETWQRKDVWDVKWSDDDPEMFATMEKQKKFVFRGTLPEEPVASNGYLVCVCVYVCGV